MGLEEYRERLQNGFAGTQGGGFGGPFRRGTNQYGLRRQDGTPGPFRDAAFRRRPQGLDPADRAMLNSARNRRGQTFSGAGAAGVGAPISAGYPGYRPPDFGKLRQLKNQEFGAAKRLITLESEAVRRQLEGDVAQTQLDRDFFVAQRERKLRGETKDVRGEALSRGILDSGIFLENLAEVETAAIEEISHERNRAAALIGGYRSQIGLLAAQRAARIASERARIEQAYFMARLSGY